MSGVTNPLRRKYNWRVAFFDLFMPPVMSLPVKLQVKRLTKCLQLLQRAYILKDTLPSLDIAHLYEGKKVAHRRAPHMYM